MLKNKVLAIYFNEYINVAFHDWSRNHESTLVHNIFFFLGIGPKWCPQTDKIAFKKSEDVIQRLRRYIKTRCFVLDNVYSDENGEASKLHRKNRNWEPEKDRRPLEGVINRFEQALRVEFGTLKRAKFQIWQKCRK